MAITEAEKELRQRASRFLKAEMKRAGVTYDQLIDKLSAMGLQETKASIANMLGRGTFPATFFIAVMQVLGRDKMDLSDI
jgi:hypothetical protein